MNTISRSIACMAVAVVFSCNGENHRTEAAQLTLSSSAFANQGAIPAACTCDGAGRIPPLSVAGVPEGAKSLALIVDDPDAPGGTWDHLVVWNLPPSTRQIAPGAGTTGRNGWGRAEWGAPCPPSGEHRYFFRLWALDRMLDLPAGSGSKALRGAIEGHVMAVTELVGRYRRSR